MTHVPLEDRVVRALIQAGEIRPRRRSAMWLLAPLAAALVLLFVHNWSAQKGSPYVFLLHQDSTYRLPPPGHMEERIHEYARWADSVGVDRGGRLIGPGEITGMFIVRAPSDADADRVAATCPHWKYGGHVEVRRFVE